MKAKRKPLSRLGDERENEKDAETRHHRRVETGGKPLPKPPHFRQWLAENGLTDTCEE